MYSEREETAAHWLKEMRKGYLRIAVLTLLSRKPFHGYELMKEIKKRTGGFWRPTAGGIYPILQSLEKSEYIEGEWDSSQRRKRKTYKITAAGKPVLQQALARGNQISENMSELFKDFVKDVLDVQSVSAPVMPDLFSVFLEDRKEKPEDTVNVLEHKRSQLENVIESIQKELEIINKRLANIEQTKKKIKRRTPN